MASTNVVFLGCYTEGAGGTGRGIVRAYREPGDPALREPELAAATPSPSFVAHHVKLPVLYACNELDEGRLTAFGVDPDGGLTELGSWPTGGALPCSVAVTFAGTHVLVANYGTGSVASFALDADGVPTHRADLVEHAGAQPVPEHARSRAGRGRHPQRQAGPHAHSVTPTGNGVLAIDLGLDTVFDYPLDPATGRFGPGEPLLLPPSGTGPRHLAVAGPDTLYLVGELAENVTAYTRSDEGWHEIAAVAASVTPGGLPSEIALSPDGRFLYVANRGPDTISVFALDEQRPVRVGEVATGGAWPRHFTIVDGRFLYVANEHSHTVVAFALDPETGLPVPTGDVLSTPSPTCVLPF